MEHHRIVDRVALLPGAAALQSAATATKVFCCEAAAEGEGEAGAEGEGEAGAAGEGEAGASEGDGEAGAAEGESDASTSPATGTTWPTTWPPTRHFWATT